MSGFWFDHHKRVKYWCWGENVTLCIERVSMKRTVVVNHFSILKHTVNSVNKSDWQIRLKYEDRVTVLCSTVFNIISLKLIKNACFLLVYFGEGAGGFRWSLPWGIFSKTKRKATNKMNIRQLSSVTKPNCHKSSFNNQTDKNVNP